jgi:YidC/Oxa1 family membrane protein insertase
MVDGEAAGTVSSLESRRLRSRTACLTYVTLETMNDQRNLILAIVLSVLILFGFQWIWPHFAPPPPAPVTGAPAVTPTQSVTAPALPVAQDRDQIVGESRRIQISTPSAHGSISLTGGKIDDLVLVGYHETPDPKSPEISLLSPHGSAEPYYAFSGWVSADTSVKLPTSDTIWQPPISNAELTPDHPVSLTWDNGNGLRFVRTFQVDANYMFTIIDRAENYGTSEQALFPFAYITRTGTPKTAGTYILHEGPLGVLDGSLKEVKYEDLRKEHTVDYKGSGGWIGITDKYWLTALVPNQATPNDAKFRYYSTGDAQDHYQVDVTATNPLTVAPGASAENSFRLFAGVKSVNLLDGDAQKYGIDKFDLAIDFGWFWFLTKPFFYLLRMLKDLIGNMGLSILAMTVLIKLAMFPLANKSFMAMGKMKQLQPELKKLQERYADDKMRLQQEMMDLYKREKVNPASGCLPMLIQIPVFFALYKVLYVTIEMRHAPFIGWIKDLSAPDPTTIFNLFGLIPWTPPEAVAHLGVWPIIMGFTMWLQQKLNPQPADPMQARMFQILPFVFTFMLGQFAAGLVIYWAWSNTLSILQQWVITRRAGAKS